MIKNRLFWPDLLRILAIYAVILIHTAAPLLVQFRQIGLKNWWIANLYNSSSRWCIPVFFMLSGAFLIERAGLDSILKFYWERSLKIIIPFLVWSAVYFAWRISMDQEQLLWISFIPLLIQEPVYYHLWFIYTLIELYLLAPIIGKYVLGADRENVAWFLLLWFLFGSVFPMLQSCCQFHIYGSLGETVTVFNYIGYFLLGHVLRDVKLRPGMTFLFLLLFLAGFFTTAYGTYYLAVKTNDRVFTSVFYDYYSVNVLAMSVSVFLLVKSFPFSINSGKLAGSIAACVPGIYFVHALVIAVLKRGVLGFTFSDKQFVPLIGIPLFSIVVFAASCCIILLMKLVPGLKHSVP